jgi:sigma-B regulation protein RsbU (phosphoserine phosphatase)
VLSAESERLRFINAGHVPPVWINSRVADRREFEASGMPIGLLPGSLYETAETVFLRGERLAVFSDGVTDAENTSGATFDLSGVVASHERINAQQLEQIGPAFFEELDRFRIGAPAKDDTTYLVIGLN